ncbi:MAG: phosphoribosylanthranilate isomerase [Planctomycetota bacterium]|jgi:phosphoribosylanthranilate isomerase
MRRVRVKICGITRKEDLDAVAVAGADAVGFVVGVASSPRNVSLTEAEMLIRQVPPFVKSVLVTVPSSLEELAKTYKKLNPNAIQIHGEDLVDKGSVREKLPNVLVIGAVKANPAHVIGNAKKTAKMFDAVLLDSFAHGKHGGTGVVHNWELSQRVKQVIHPKPLILAGGLTSENVAEAVRAVEPYAVDVSSGVERQPRIKDQQKMIEFVKNAKGC